jgi:hypothetical protein
VVQELTHPSVEKEVDLLHSHMQQSKEKPQVEFHVELSSVPEVLLQHYKRGGFTNSEKQSKSSRESSSPSERAAEWNQTERGRAQLDLELLHGLV